MRWCWELRPQTGTEVPTPLTLSAVGMGTAHRLQERRKGGLQRAGLDPGLPSESRMSKLEGTPGSFCSDPHSVNRELYAPMREASDWLGTDLGIESMPPNPSP